MTSARKKDLIATIQGLPPSSNPRWLTTTLIELLEEVKTTDDTLPRKCFSCGRITYFDPITERHHCKYCEP